MYGTIFPKKNMTNTVNMKGRAGDLRIFMIMKKSLLISRNSLAISCHARLWQARSIRKIIELDPKTGKEVEAEIVSYFPVNFFDIAQIEGEPLPEVDIRISGDNYTGFFQTLVDFCKSKNIQVDFKNLGINKKAPQFLTVL